MTFTRVHFNPTTFSGIKETYWSNHKMIFFFFGRKGVTNAIITIHAGSPNFLGLTKRISEGMGQVISSASKRTRPPSPSPERPRGRRRRHSAHTTSPRGTGPTSSSFPFSYPAVYGADSSGLPASGQPGPTLVSFQIAEFILKPLGPGSA